MARLIRALLDFTKMKPSALRDFAHTVYSGINGNPAVYPNPPISMETFAAQLETFSSWVVEAMDGSRKAIAERNSAGDELRSMLLQLAKYVEHASKGDMAAFLLSGFHPAPDARTQTPAISEGIRKIRYGANSGELDFRAVAVPGASSYEIRWAERNADGTPGEWTVKSFGKTKGYFTIKGLKPGTVYLFQVRALIDDVFTNWSDPVSKMCL
jgi:hypothetical protein